MTYHIYWERARKLFRTPARPCLNEKLPGRVATRAGDARETPTQSHQVYYCKKINMLVESCWGSNNYYTCGSLTSMDTPSSKTWCPFASERIGNTVKSFDDFQLKAKARTWTCLSYICHTGAFHKNRRYQPLRSHLIQSDFKVVLQKSTPPEVRHLILHYHSYNE